jgi:DNA-binding NarL/FixJ family response regulator
MTEVSSPAAGKAIAIASASWKPSFSAGSGADGSVAIVLERVASESATAPQLETHGVTEREREVAVLLAQGLSNPEIAATLVLSPYTVQDHIKSLFEKTSVSSRQELVACVFLDDYMPQIVRGSAPTSGGTFADSDGATS